MPAWRRRALAVARTLVGPPAFAREGWGRQNGLLAVLLVVMMALALLSTAILVVTRVGGVASVPASVGTAVLLALAYYLNRHGAYALAARLTVIISAVAVWGLLIFDPPNIARDTLSLAYLSIPILVTGLLLPVWPTLVVLAGNVLVLLVLQPTAPAALAPNTLIYLSIMGGLTLVTTALRERHLSEIEQANRDLAASVAQFQNAFEHASIGIALVSLNGRWLRANHSLCALLGYTEAELQAVDFQSLTHPEDLVADLTQVRRMLAGEFNAYQMEKRYFHKQGHLVWTSLSVSLLRAADGTPLHFITQIQDISQRKQVEDALRASEARFRSLSQASPVGIFETDAQGRDIYHNARWYDMTGLSEAEALNDGWLRAVHPADRDALAAEWARCVRERQAFAMDYRYLNRDGETRWAQSRASRIRSGSGEVAGYVGTVADITERKASEAALQAANERMSVWVDELEQRTREIGLLNELSNLLQSCLNAQEAYGLLQQIGLQLFPQQAGLLGMTNASRNIVETVVAWGAGDDAAAPAAFSPEDCWALRRGRPHWYEAGTGAVACPHLGQAEPPTALCLPMMAHGETLGVLHLRAATAGVPALTAPRRGFAQTVADSVSLALANLKLRERLRDQSIRDVLTGLYNRRYLEETLDRELRRAERDHLPLCVLMLDIDHFKRFNDSFGHAAGDDVLRALGRLLGRQLRVEDIACRYGGEEFTLVMPGCSLEVACQRADELRQQVHDLYVTHAGQPVGGITVSVGVVAMPQHGGSEAGLLRAADQALYQAKQFGRNQVIVAPLPPAASADIQG